MGRLDHDLVDVDAVRCPVLGQHLPGDIGQDDDAQFIVLAARLDDEGLGIDVTHGLQGGGHRRHAIDQIEMGLHDLADAESGSVIHGVIVLREDAVSLGTG
jgi:hypothetical protein